MPDVSLNSATQERRSPPRPCPIKGKDFDLSCRLRIIIDTSVYIDLFSERNEKRVQLAEKLFNCTNLLECDPNPWLRHHRRIKSKGNSVRLYGPRLLLIELAGVLIRYTLPRAVSNII
jgi:hypothetical protein